MTNKEKLQELSQAFASLQKKYEELKGAMPMKDEDMKDHQKKMMDMHDHMMQMMSNVHARIDNLANNTYDWQDNHSQSHLPKLTAGQLQKLLDSCGAGQDYNIIKKPIFASVKGKGNNKFLEAEYKKVS